MKKGVFTQPGSNPAISNATSVLRFSLESEHPNPHIYEYTA